MSCMLNKKLIDTFVVIIFALRYDAFLLDQWGVMHDGSKAHVGAIECMKKLAAAGKKIILISNSSKRVGTSMKKLDKMGFDSSTVIHCLISIFWRSDKIAFGYLYWSVSKLT